MLRKRSVKLGLRVALTQFSIMLTMLCDVYEDSSSHTIGFAASGMHRRISAKSLSS